MVWGEGSGSGALGNVGIFWIHGGRIMGNVGIFWIHDGRMTRNGVGMADHGGNFWVHGAGTGNHGGKLPGRVVETGQWDTDKRLNEIISVENEGDGRDEWNDVDKLESDRWKLALIGALGMR